jgi:hypothetical protein
MTVMVEFLWGICILLSLVCKVRPINKIQGNDAEKNKLKLIDRACMNR